MLLNICVVICRKWRKRIPPITYFMLAKSLIIIVLLIFTTANALQYCQVGKWNTSTHSNNSQIFGFFGQYSGTASKQLILGQQKRLRARIYGNCEDLSKYIEIEISLQTISEIKQRLSLKKAQIKFSFIQKVQGDYSQLQVDLREQQYQVLYEREKSLTISHQNDTLLYIQFHPKLASQINNYYCCLDLALLSLLFYSFYLFACFLCQSQEEKHKKNNKNYERKSTQPSIHMQVATLICAYMISKLLKYRHIQFGAVQCCLQDLFTFAFLFIFLGVTLINLKATKRCIIAIIVPFTASFLMLIGVLSYEIIPELIIVMEVIRLLRLSLEDKDLQIQDKNVIISIIFEVTSLHLALFLVIETSCPFLIVLSFILDWAIVYIEITGGIYKNIRKFKWMVEKKQQQISVDGKASGKEGDPCPLCFRRIHKDQAAQMLLSNQVTMGYCGHYFHCKCLQGLQTTFKCPIDSITIKKTDKCAKNK